jgi:hypothetical protein
MCCLPSFLAICLPDLPALAQSLDNATQLSAQIAPNGQCSPYANTLIIWIVPSPTSAHYDWAAFYDIAYGCKVRKLVVETYDQNGGTPGDTTYLLGNNPYSNPPISCDAGHVNAVVSAWTSYLAFITANTKLSVPRDFFTLSIGVKNECAAGVPGEYPYLNQRPTDVGCVALIAASFHAAGFNDVAMFGIDLLGSQAEYSAAQLAAAIIAHF